MLEKFIQVWELKKIKLIWEWLSMEEDLKLIRLKFKDLMLAPREAQTWEQVRKTFSITMT